MPIRPHAARPWSLHRPHVLRRGARPPTVGPSAVPSPAGGATSTLWQGRAFAHSTAPLRSPAQEPTSHDHGRTHATAAGSHDHDGGAFDRRAIGAEELAERAHRCVDFVLKSLLRAAFPAQAGRPRARRYKAATDASAGLDDAPAPAGPKPRRRRLVRRRRDATDAERPIAARAALQAEVLAVRDGAQLDGAQPAPAAVELPRPPAAVGGAGGAPWRKALSFYHCAADAGVAVSRSAVAELLRAVPEWVSAIGDDPAAPHPRRGRTTVHTPPPPATFVGPPEPAGNTVVYPESTPPLAKAKSGGSLGTPDEYLAGRRVNVARWLVLEEAVGNLRLTFPGPTPTPGSQGGHGKHTPRSTTITAHSVVQARWRDVLSLLDGSTGPAPRPAPPGPCGVKLQSVPAPAVESGGSRHRVLAHGLAVYGEAVADFLLRPAASAESVERLLQAPPPQLVAALPAAVARAAHKAAASGDWRRGLLLARAVRPFSPWARPVDGKPRVSVRGTAAAASTTAATLPTPEAEPEVLQSTALAPDAATGTTPAQAHPHGVQPQRGSVEAQDSPLFDPVTAADVAGAGLTALCVAFCGGDISARRLKRHAAALAPDAVLMALAVAGPAAGETAVPPKHVQPSGAAGQTAFAVAAGQAAAFAACGSWRRALRRLPSVANTAPVPAVGAEGDGLDRAGAVALVRAVLAARLADPELLALAAAASAAPTAPTATPSALDGGRPRHGAFLGPAAAAASSVAVAAAAPRVRDAAARRAMALQLLRTAAGHRRAGRLEAALATDPTALLRAVARPDAAVPVAELAAAVVVALGHHREALGGSKGRAARAVVAARTLRRTARTSALPPLTLGHLLSFAAAAPATRPLSRADFLGVRRATIAAGPGLAPALAVLSPAEQRGVRAFASTPRATVQRARLRRLARLSRGALPPSPPPVTPASVSSDSMHPAEPASQASTEPSTGALARAAAAAADSGDLTAALALHAQIKQAVGGSAGGGTDGPNAALLVNAHADTLRAARRAGRWDAVLAMHAACLAPATAEEGSAASATSPRRLVGALGLLAPATAGVSEATLRGRRVAAWQTVTALRDASYAVPNGAAADEGEALVSSCVRLPGPSAGPAPPMAMRIVTACQAMACDRGQWRAALRLAATHGGIVPKKGSGAPTAPETEAPCENAPAGMEQEQRRVLERGLHACALRGKWREAVGLMRTMLVRGATPGPRDMAHLRRSFSKARVPLTVGAAEFAAEGGDVRTAAALVFSRPGGRGKSGSATHGGKQRTSD